MIRQIIRLNIDNRILNNLRWQLNNEVKDAKGLVQKDVFKNLFFTYFKGEKYAYQVYEMLWPCIREFHNFERDSTTDVTDPQGVEVARISTLTQFIDLFNYYPVPVNKLRYKNDSDGLTYVMSSGVKGSKNERGEVV